MSGLCGTIPLAGRLTSMNPTSRRLEPTRILAAVGIGIITSLTGSLIALLFLPFDTGGRGMADGVFANAGISLLAWLPLALVIGHPFRRRSRFFQITLAVAAIPGLLLLYETIVEILGP
jgi:hypothetical protein